MLKFVTGDQPQHLLLVLCRHPLPAGQATLGSQVSAAPSRSICSRPVSLHRSRKGCGSKAAGSPRTTAQPMGLVSWPSLHCSIQHHHRQQSLLPATTTSWSTEQSETAGEAIGVPAIPDKACPGSCMPWRQPPAATACCAAGSWHPGAYPPHSPADIQMITLDLACARIADGAVRRRDSKLCVNITQRERYTA
jgi:hypothetical protein